MHTIIKCRVAVPDFCLRIAINCSYDSIDYFDLCYSDPLLFGDDQTPLNADDWPDLSLLKPLWTLYTKTMGTETGTNIGCCVWI